MGPLIARTSMLRIEVISSVSRKMTVLVDIRIELEGKANEDKNVKKYMEKAGGVVAVAVVE